MNRAFLILLITSHIYGQKLNAQSEIEQINFTVLKYIEGTKNGNPDKVKKAFHKDFNLFLIQEDTLRIIDGKDYIQRIKRGKKYNRIGRIISLDYENNAASAKVEVYFPDTKRIATDYLLLLKISGQWKILHKIINLREYKKTEDLVTTEKDGLEKIRETLSWYIEGTANGKPKKLKEAFHNDFYLYYIKNDELSIIPGEQYIKNFTVGKKSNRIGNILSLDYQNDAGLAKVQVLFPDRNRIAIDYLLLLKVNDKWKIIHKSFTTKDYTE